MTGDKKINFGWVIVAYGVLCMLVLHYGTIRQSSCYRLRKIWGSAQQR